MNVRIILVFTLLIAYSACKTQKQTVVDPRENINSAITHAISLLEEKKYQQFIEKYALPEDLQKILKNKTIEELAESFGKGKSEKVLDALKLAKEITPKYDESGTMVTFSKGEVGGMSKDMVFKKVGKLWYIAN